MGTILNLPPEILDEISSQLLPHSIESFVLTCRTLYVRSAPIIQRHNAYRARWRKTTHQGFRNDLSAMLLEIVNDPLSAQYIEKLHLWDQRSHEEISAAMSKAKNRYDGQWIAHHWQPLVEMVKESAILKEADVDAELWLDDLRWESWCCRENSDVLNHDYRMHVNCVNDDGPHLTITLLTLLLLFPELKELGLPAFWKGLRENEPQASEEIYPACQRLLKHLIQRPRFDSPHIGPSSLGKLETLLPYGKPGYDERIALQNIEYFLPLPNLQNVYSVSGIADFDGYTGIPFDWQPHNSVVNMVFRRLELSSCVCDGEGLRRLLSRTPLLEVFKYHLEVKWHGCGSELEAKPFLDAVGDCVGTTLKELAIITIDATQIEEPISDFKAFSRLEKLECDFNDLLPEGEPVSLMKILPTTLKEVIFDVKGYELHLYDFELYLSDIRERKAMGFLELESVAILAYGTTTQYSTLSFADCQPVVEKLGATWVTRGDCTGSVGWDAEFYTRFGCPCYPGAHKNR